MADNLDELERLATAYLDAASISAKASALRALRRAISLKRLLALIERVRRAEGALRAERDEYEGDPAESVVYPPLRGEPPLRGVRIPGRD